ncbi:hypothetical protein CYMTET_31283 [Cymbomonas tetramitiformis]|uniref:Uncharacterized protein n=1 Tax=Cymbomonas tetramitiformis TaxID=36881 RepID=A0AAE0FH40_9CHLO|nr:hypothetical protein CYMTET_31283 [Cymbomonas tetramitiformis]
MQLTKKSLHFLEDRLELQMRDVELTQLVAPETSRLQLEVEHSSSREEGRVGVQLRPRRTPPDPPPVPLALCSKSFLPLEIAEGLPRQLHLRPPALLLRPHEYSSCKYSQAAGTARYTLWQSLLKATSLRAGTQCRSREASYSGSVALEQILSRACVTRKTPSLKSTSSPKCSTTWTGTHCPFFSFLFRPKRFGTRPTRCRSSYASS